MDKTAYLEVYLQETEELLAKLDQGLVELEQNPSPELIAELFRVVHTLKGSAGGMGYTQVMNLCHSVEDVLGKMRAGQLEAGSALITWLLKCADAIRSLINEAVDKQAPKTDVRALIAESATFTRGQAPEKKAAINTLTLTPQEQKALQFALARGESFYQIKIHLSEACPFKGARLLLVLRGLARAAEIVRSSATAEELEDQAFTGEITLWVLSQWEASELEALIQDLIPARELQTAQVSRASEMELGAKVTSSNQRQINVEKRLGHAPTIRVDVSKLDTLLNRSGELVISHARLAQLVGQSGQKELVAASRDLERLILELQEAVMKVRLIPLEQVFARFPRLVRDLAHELGRQVDFVVRGAETEVDRTVAEELGEPLIHLIRNALDHGLESPAERSHVGKPPTGTLKLSAHQEGEVVVISLADDGRGIDPEQIRASLAEKGTYSPAELAQMEKHELLNMIFQAGFSTAKKVSDISGRGVGMDIVRNKIETIGGSVRLMSTPGAGTTIEVRLPLTLAIMQALLCQVGQERYALPLSYLEELVFADAAEIKTIRGCEVLLRHERIVPLIHLAQVLGIAETEVKKERAVVILNNGQMQLGCIVDAFLGKENIVVKPLGNYLGQIPLISGATILGDGRVVLILDPRALGK